MYICINCKEESTVDDRVRCPHCGFRILVKKRPMFRKRVEAR